MVLQVSLLAESNQSFATSVSTALKIAYGTAISFLFRCWSRSRQAPVNGFGGKVFRVSALLCNLKGVVFDEGSQPGRTVVLSKFPGVRICRCS